MNPEPEEPMSESEDLTGKVVLTPMSPGRDAEFSEMLAEYRAAREPDVSASSTSGTDCHQGWRKSAATSATGFGLLRASAGRQPPLSNWHCCA
jgi:hypothetical protein